MAPSFHLSRICLQRTDHARRGSNRIPSSPLSTFISLTLAQSLCRTRRSAISGGCSLRGGRRVSGTRRKSQSSQNRRDGSNAPRSSRRICRKRRKMSLFRTMLVNHMVTGRHQTLGPRCHPFSLRLEGKAINLVSMCTGRIISLFQCQAVLRPTPCPRSRRVSRYPPHTRPVSRRLLSYSIWIMYATFLNGGLVEASDTAFRNTPHIF